MSAREGAFVWAMEVVKERRMLEEGQGGEDRRRRVSMVNGLLDWMKDSMLGGYLGLPAL